MDTRFANVYVLCLKFLTNMGHILRMDNLRAVFGLKQGDKVRSLSNISIHLWFLDLTARIHVPLLLVVN